MNKKDKQMKIMMNHQPTLSPSDRPKNNTVNDNSQGLNHHLRIMPQSPLN